MKKLLLIAGIIIVVAVAGFFALNNYIYQKKQGNPEYIKAYQGTLTGEFVCLPHTENSGPQTMECAFGIKTITGEYYALDFNQLSQAKTGITQGDTFTANGTITPIEMLSSDHWKKYPIQGIFTLTGSVKKD